MPLRAAAILIYALLLLGASLWSSAFAADASEVLWCHGVLVAPQLALVTAQCAQRATIVLLAENSREAAVMQRKITTTNPLDRESLSSGLAIASLETPVDSRSALIQLETQATAPAPSESLLGFALQASNRRLQPADAIAVAVNNFSVTVVPLQLCGDNEVEVRNAPVPTHDVVACVLEQWSDVETCQSSSASESSVDRIVTRVVGSHKYVYGFAASLSRAACTLSGFRTTLVRLVPAATSSLIQAAILKSTETSGSLSTNEAANAIKFEDGSSSSNGGSTDPQEPRNASEPTISITLPPISDTLEPEHTVGTSSSSSATGSEPKDTVEIPAPAPAMESYLPSNYALLSSSPNSSVGAIAVAVLVAPRFLVANTEWLTNINGSTTTTTTKEQPAERVSLALFSNGDRVPVRRLWLESDFHAATDFNNAICSQRELACSLVVIELERDAASPTAPFSLAASLPPQGIDMKEIQLSVYDPALLRSEQTFDFVSFAMESQSACKPSDEDSVPVSGLQCIDSTEPIASSAASTPEAPFTSAFATFGSDPVLLGLSVGTEMRLQVGKHVSQAFIQLAAAPHRRFLDNVSNNTVTWSEALYSVDDSWSQVSSAAVSFFGGHNDKRANALDCGGIAIASKFILTTATCALSHKISSISFGGRAAASSNDERVKIEDAFQVVSHPKYANSNTRTRYNIALIKLDSTVTLSKWIDLDDVAQDPGTRVVRMGLDGPTWHPEKIQDTSACAPGLPGDTATSAEELSGLVCAGSQTNDDPSAAALPKSSMNSLLLHKTLEGTVLVGLQLPATTRSEKFTAKLKASQSNLYVSVFDAMRFIKAVADGYSFGVRARPPPPLFGGARPMNPKQPAQSQSSATLLDSQRYVVGLRVSKDGHNFCGGSLVAPTFVLTAAHCVSEGLASWVSVGSSASSRSDTELIKVLNVRVHPLYGSPTSYSFDAAILELEAAAYAPTVALDNSVDFGDSVVGTMFGYGAASSTSSTLSPSIRILSLPLWSRESCAKVLPDVDESFLCAGGRSESGNDSSDDEDACTGDSGSPLIVTGTNGKDYLAGIVSSGYGCGIPGVPGLYSRVFAIASFINAYVVEPTWLYPAREGGRENGRDDSFESGTDQNSPIPSTTGTRAASLDGTDSSGSKNHFPKLVPCTGAAGSGFTGSAYNETREAADSNATPQTSTTTTSNRAAVLTYESAISKVSLRENLSPSVQSAVLQFVIGAYDHVIVSSVLVDQLSGLNNRVSLFSSGRLEGLVAAIDRHDALRLNQRKDRFGSMGRRRKEPGAVRLESCNDTT